MYKRQSLAGRIYDINRQFIQRSWHHTCSGGVMLSFDIHTQDSIWSVWQSWRLPSNVLSLCQCINYKANFLICSTKELASSFFLLILRIQTVYSSQIAFLQPISMRVCSSNVGTPFLGANSRARCTFLHSWNIAIVLEKHLDRTQSI